MGWRSGSSTLGLGSGQGRGSPNPGPNPNPGPSPDPNQVEQFDEGWLCLLHAATGVGAAGPIGGPRFRTDERLQKVCATPPS